VGIFNILSPMSYPLFSVFPLRIVLFSGRVTILTLIQPIAFYPFRPNQLFSPVIFLNNILLLNVRGAERNKPSKNDLFSLGGQRSQHDTGICTNNPYFMPMWIYLFLRPLFRKLNYFITHNGSYFRYNMIKKIVRILDLFLRLNLDLSLYLQLEN
jgi:hypothetical protein